MQWNPIHHDCGSLRQNSTELIIPERKEQVEGNLLLPALKLSGPVYYSANYQHPAYLRVRFHLMHGEEVQ